MKKVEDTILETGWRILKLFAKEFVRFMLFKGSTGCLGSPMDCVLKFFFPLFSVGFWIFNLYYFPLVNISNICNKKKIQISARELKVTYRVLTYILFILFPWNNITLFQALDLCPLFHKVYGERKNCNILKLNDLFKCTWLKYICGVWAMYCIQWTTGTALLFNKQQYFFAILLCQQIFEEE